jgi:hypothetical protein
MAPAHRTALRAAAPLVVALAGCAATAVQAPFPVRPDTVVPGDLAGPFDGQVLDAQSGKPVEGAAVLGSWAFQTGDGRLSGPATARFVLAQTDADGRYRIGRLSELTDGRLDRFTLIVYKQGYIGYRSDRRFEDFSPRRDFAQSGNVARLDHPPSDLSHVRHLRFIGAGGPLLPRLSSELQLASVEAETMGVETAAEKEAPAGAGLDASLLLKPDEVKAATGYKGTFTVDKLGDIPSTANYDSVHFAAESEPEKYDVGLRVFRLDPQVVERQFEVMVRELPGAEEKNEVGDRSVRAREADILALGALDRAHGVILLFTCGEAQCKDFETMATLMKRMFTRIPRLGRAVVEKPAAKAPGEQPSEQPKVEEEEKPEQGGGDQGGFKLKPPELHR